MEIFGCTREQLLGQTPFRFSPAIQPDGHNSKEKAQEIITLALQGVPQHFDWRHIRYDGTPFDAEISLNRTELSGQMFLQAIVRDVTERKRAEKALRKERDMTQKYLDIAEVIFAIINTDQRIALMNKKGCEILEYQLEEIIGRKVDILAPERLKKEIKNRANKVFTGKMELAEYIERPVLTKSGQERIFALHQTLLRDDEGNITGFLSSGVDITERKRVEEELRRARDDLEAKVAERTKELTQANLRLQELDRLKSMFIASMSHELRTPLNSVIGFSSILLDEWMGHLNDEQKKNLSIVLRSGQHLLALINDVIDVSKIEAGQIEPFIKDFDLHEVISEAATFLSKQVNQKNLELKVESAHHMMHTDKRRLLQCLLNLISNAAKFTEEGYVCLDARIVECSQTPPCAQISVTDTGSGIKQEDLPKLFFSFSRIESPFRKKVPGTGLGLYLTKKLVTEILKGEISVKSDYGVGSTFTIKIPVRIKYNGEVKNVSKQ